MVTIESDRQKAENMLLEQKNKLKLDLQRDVQVLLEYASSNPDKASQIAEAIELSLEAIDFGSARVQYLLIRLRSNERLLKELAGDS